MIPSDLSLAWPMETVLTFYTGKFITPIEQVYKFADWFEQTEHWTHELGSGSQRIQPLLREAYPELAEAAELITTACENGEIKAFEDVYRILSPFSKEVLVRRPDVSRPAALSRVFWKRQEI